MKWRKAQPFDPPAHQREGSGHESCTMGGDELPLVSSPPPRLSSSASSSLSSTHLSALEDSSTSTSVSRKDPPRTVSLTALTFTAGPGMSEVPAATMRDPAAAPSPAVAATRVSVPSEPQTPVRSSATPRPASTTTVHIPPSPARPAPTRPVSAGVSPHHPPHNHHQRHHSHSVSAPQSVVSSPHRVPVGPQRASASSGKIGGSPSRPAASPQRIAVNLQEPANHQSAPVSPAKVVVSPAKASSTPQVTTGSEGVVVVVNGGVTANGQARSPGHLRAATTTIPVGDGGSGSSDPQQTSLKASPGRKSVGSRSTGGGAGEGKRATHEKNKSVTIVVNDQQVAYTSSNGVANGGVHPEAATHGEATRPPSSASTQPGGKADPDMQVRPLVGWWGGEGGSAGSVLEDAASSDDCHRSTLTLVHSPARTLSRAVSVILYLSGEAGDAMVGEDSGEAWSGGVTGLCGVALVLGAAVWLRLPGLLYEFGAGNFLAAWCGAVLVVAAPLALLEASLAQFSSSAAIALWRLIPIARGVGWSTVVVCVYWAAVVLGSLAPVLHYLLLTLNPALLVGTVDSCCTASPNNTSTGDWVLHYHRSCVYQLPEEWHHGLRLTFSWPLPSCMAAAALIATIMGVCGARTLAGLLAGASTFALTGLSLQVALAVVETLRRDEVALWEMARPFLTPHPHTLLQPRVWCAAVAQVLLSLGLGVGLLMSFSSRSSFRFSLRRHLFGLLVLVVLVTAVVAGVSVLQLTILASDRGVTLDRALDHHRTPLHTLHARLNESRVVGVELGTMGMGVAGVGMGVSAAVITTTHLISLVSFSFPWLKQLVATLIYIGLWCSGLTTVTACVHMLVTALRDAWDCLPRVLAALMVAPILVAAAIITTTASGAAVVDLMDREVLILMVLWPPFTLTLAITTIYGIQKLRKDFTFMLESAVCWLWIPVWGFLLPFTLLGVVVWLCVMEGGSVVVADGPGWKVVAVWGLRMMAILPLPITAIYVVKSQLAYGVVDKVASSLQSSREWGDWGPQDPIEHHNWRRWREDETRPITTLKRRLASRPLTYTHSTLSSESSSTLTRLRNKYQRNGAASVL
ncbi:sodium- and chloride-dependent glycine transporter 2-like isoform X2 [Eriocheir sinensis]|uniref:sodium- and chloride-dependent glycine transporter 2-like isoform X2 n=1 Tax=Eriocheir sinensis TaxID=95602 RepID=UPI0021C6A8A2|nr:sodium- and chloride-dependent glycine transporter 2-like isoform X2 [Eriocheir sinensis]